MLPFLNTQSFEARRPILKERTFSPVSAAGNNRKVLGKKLPEIKH
jgi:hypothetical protein